MRALLMLGLCLALIAVGSLPWPRLALAQPTGRRFVSIADVTVTGAVTTVRAADATRIALVCTNTHASVHVRIGDTLSTATRGAQLRAGLSATITSTAEISAISEGANVTLACSEELR